MAFLRPRLRAAATFGLAVATIVGITSTAAAAEPMPTVTGSEAAMAQAGPGEVLPVHVSTAALLQETPLPAALVPETLLPDALLPDVLLPDVVGAPADLLPSQLAAVSLRGVLADVLLPDVVGAPADLLPSQIAAVSLPGVLAERLGAAPVVTSANSLAARVIRDARSHLGARYAHGARGPRVFDCIGLVLRSYAQAGAISKIGGWTNASGYSLYRWARQHHLTSTTHGQPGDIVVWGGGGHVGIYLGNGKAISALVSGVRIHGIHAVTKRFTAFIHTGLSGILAKPAPKTKTSPRAHVRSIGIRHVAKAIELRIGHSGADQVVSKLKAGTRLTLLRTWRDPHGKLWYRVNANRHVGWVVASFTHT